MVGAQLSIASPGTPSDAYVEGTYYGSEKISFSLSVTRDNFIKTYSNGITIIGKKDNGEAIYYFINKNKKLITKVSQGNLYRVGEFTSWDSMVGLLNLKPGTKLVKDNQVDEKESCTLYHAEPESMVRICMNDALHVPVYIEQNGTVVERTTRIESFNSSLETTGLLAKYLKEKYRYVDADDDLSPDAD